MALPFCYRQYRYMTNLSPALMTVSALALVVLLTFALARNFVHRAFAFAALSVAGFLALFLLARDIDTDVHGLVALALLAAPVTAVLVWLTCHLTQRLIKAGDEPRASQGGDAHD